MPNIRCRTDFDRCVCQPGYGGSHKFSFRSPLAYDFALLLFWPLKARFGHCTSPAAHHVIGVLLADDNHKPVLVDGKPVTALVPVITKVGN